MKNLTEFSSDKLKRFDRNTALNLCYDFFSASLIITILYRICFFITIYKSSTYFHSFFLAVLSLGLINDLIVCASLTLLFYLITRFIQLITIQPLHKINTFFIEVFFFISIFLLASVELANIKIYDLLRIPINYTMIASYLVNNSTLDNLVPFVTKLDYFVIVCIFLVYLSIKRIQQSILKLTLLFILIFSYLIFSLYGSFYFFNIMLSKQNKHFIALYNNPIHILMSSFIREHNAFNSIKIPLTDAQSHSITLLDPIFLNQTKTPAPLTMQHKKLHKQLNVVIFVLESVGKNYIFESDGTDFLAMPFLHKLSQQGVWLENNYSGGNISALGQFSIFTGIYPNPTPVHFELQSNLYLPSIASWLGKSYDSFLVSASNNLYFSMGLNKTFTEYDNAEIIGPNENLVENIFLDEREGFNFFLHRLNKTDKPFLGVYWSAATHFPYKITSEGNLFLNNHDNFIRYKHNLRLLDNEIKQTFELLRKKNVLDHTIFIVVGDHGEMFGQHQAVIHGTTVYQNEIKVPLLIYAPKLLKSAKINKITSSADILPTILDMLNVPHQSFLQGESLLQPSQRKYVFVYGDNDDIASIDNHQMKMVISFANATCNMYDLASDQQEEHPLPCNNQHQQEAILKFRSFQPQLLGQYNERSREQLKRDN